MISAIAPDLQAAIGDARAALRFGAARSIEILFVGIDVGVAQQIKNILLSIVRFALRPSIAGIHRDVSGRIARRAMRCRYTEA